MTNEAPPTRPPAPRATPTEADAGRLRKAFLASARDELLAPANAIRETCRALCYDLEGLVEETHRAQQRFLADLGKIAASADGLVGLIEETLGPAAPGREGAGLDPRELQSRVRHDMRAALNLVINYAELWIEEAAEHGVEGFVPELCRIREQGRRCGALLDRILDSLEVRDADLARQQPGVRAILDEVVAYMRPDDEAGTAPAAETGRILVVDDNPDNRDLLRRRLARQGHDVAVAANGREALERVAAGAIDLVLLDIIMPELTGFQVLERLKADEWLRDVPVIMITALEEIDSVARCIEMGAEDYLPKPFNPVVLRARIGACLEKKRLRDREVLHLRQIEEERRRSDELLHVILPHEIVGELRRTNEVKPRRYDNVAVLFADIVGFTPYCDCHPPEEVVRYLQQLVETWEDLALLHGVEKIKTIGDAFMAACGLLKRVENPVLNCVRCGLDMIAAAQRLPNGWNLRVGIHAGQVVAGVLGRRQYLFDLWGDTVNTAARMESHGVPGAITLSAEAWRRVADCCRGEPLGAVHVKGKGELQMVRFVDFTA
jgi:class 3 adenylate cyclase